MHDAAFGVPLLLTIEGDDIPFPEGGNSWGKLNVVGNEHGLAGRKAQDKALVALPVVVVGQNLDDDALSCSLHATLMFCHGGSQNRIALPRKMYRIIGKVELTPADRNGYDKENYSKQLLHGHPI
jgi:hypothetical protein